MKLSSSRFRFVHGRNEALPHAQMEWTHQLIGYWAHSRESRPLVVSTHLTYFVYFDRIEFTLERGVNVVLQLEIRGSARGIKSLVVSDGTTSW